MYIMYKHEGMFYSGRGEIKCGTRAHTNPSVPGLKKMVVRSLKKLITLRN